MTAADEGTGTGATPDRVLIVEDDERIASFLIKGLGANGFIVEWVQDGSAAIAAVEQGGIAAVLLDLGLPDVDGLDVLRGWSDAGCTVPVVVLTARSDPRDRETALSLGAVSYLTKPAPFRNVVAAIRAATDIGRS